MGIFIVLLEFGAITHTSTAHVDRVHLKVAGVEELQLLLGFGTTCRLALYEKKPHTESDRINPVDGVNSLGAELKRLDPSLVSM